MNNDLLKNLLTISSPSGREDLIREYILKEIDGLVDEVKVDTLGNIIAHKKADAPKMLVAAHMDQIGFMITFIEEDGFLRFSNLGGFSAYELISRRIRFENGLEGVIAVEHLEKISDFNFNKLYIDIGAKNKEEAEKNVKIGDVCVYSAKTVIDDLKIMSPSIDNRVACYALIETMKKVDKPAFDTYYVFTVQEEVGLRGAKTAAYQIDADYAIAVDVTVSYDTPKALSYSMKLGEGACIKIKDSSVLCHPRIIKLLEDVAKEEKIKFQYEILDGGGTDAGAIHTTKEGVPTGAISVATRNIHTDSEICYQEDLKATIELLAKTLEKGIS